MQSVTLNRGSIFINEVQAPSSCDSTQIIVKVRAVGLTSLDAGFTYDLSRFLRARRRKSGTGSSFLGEVVHSGAEASRFVAGDVVVGFVLSPYTDSTLATYIAVEESVCCRKPSELSEAEAVSAVTDFMIAERTLRLAKVAENDSILITGGATALTKTLIELAKSSMFGVEWVASTVRSLEERAYSESVGADETFDVSCNKGMWACDFQDGPNRKEYEIVIDVVGDSKNAKRLLKRGKGRWISLLNKPTAIEVADYNARTGFRIFSKFSASFLSSRFGNMLTGCSGRAKLGKYFSAIPTGNGEILERLFVLIQAGEVTTSLERVVSLKEAAAELEGLRADPFSLRGRIVVELYPV